MDLDELEAWYDTSKEELFTKFIEESKLNKTKAEKNFKEKTEKLRLKYTKQFDQIMSKKDKKPFFKLHKK